MAELSKLVCYVILKERQIFPRPIGVTDINCFEDVYTTPIAQNIYQLLVVEENIYSLCIE
jgi:hypothetical protein